MLLLRAYPWDSDELALKHSWASGVCTVPQVNPMCNQGGKPLFYSVESWGRKMVSCKLGSHAGRNCIEDSEDSFVLWMACCCWGTNSCLTLLWPRGLETTRLLRPRDFPGKNSVTGCHFLRPGIFLTQELNPHVLHWRRILYCWETEKGSLNILYI